MLRRYRSRSVRRMRSPRPVTMELPCTSRRIGLNGGALQAMVNAPLYLTMPVCSRASIGLGYASALILTGRYDDSVAVLSNPVIGVAAQ